MIRTILIDEDPDARLLLKTILNENCAEIEIIATESTATEGLGTIIKLDPELVILDIKFRDGDTYELLSNLHPINFNIIFTSSIDSYPIRAMKFAAIDYLLKPVNVLELKAAIFKVQQKIFNVSRYPGNENITESENSNHQYRKIALPTLQGFELVTISDIIRCEARGSYTDFYLVTGQKIMVCHYLKEVEELLKDEAFYRVHHSSLVNLNNVKKYFKGNGGYLIMSDESKVEVSIRKKERFLKQLSRH